VAEVAALPELAAEVWRLLAVRRPGQVTGLPGELHQLPPFLPKAFWEKIGDAVRAAERPGLDSVPGSRFITLRLDGTGFSKLLGRLRAAGVFARGFSPEFAEIMGECCRSLTTKLNARCGYTQSDEMLVLLAPASVVRGVQQPHLHNGRVMKLCTQAAAHVTALFNHKVQAICAARHLTLEESCLATFDCRLGHYGSLEEALGLLLWRAYDCGVNGVSDAVFHRRGEIPGAKQAMGHTTDKKLLWLAEAGLLPLQPHQAHGSFFVKTRRRIEGCNPTTGQIVVTLRGVLEEVSGNVLCNAASGTLFPEDDDLPPSATDDKAGGPL